MIDTLVTVLQWINDAVIEEFLATTPSKKSNTELLSKRIVVQRPFEPKKPLRERDEMILALLNSAGHENVSYCVCDPALKDCPIIFASDGFCTLTGYTFQEIEGQNCRFLQGRETKVEDIKKIRHAIETEQESSVNLLNYKKDGTPFNNQFFIMPMYDEEDSDGGNNKKLQYFAGIQCSVQKLGPGQCPQNVGWIYTSGLHA